MVPPKKALPNQHPPPPEEVEESSSEEEEEEEEGEEEEEEKPSEESDGEEKKENPNVPQNQISQAKRKLNIAEESEESEEEDLEEAPASPSASDFTIKVISPKKPTPKDTKPASKRPSETSKIDEKALRSKKKAKVSEENLKKEKSSGGSAGRVCSEEDELRILQGLIDYQEQTGVDAADMGAFHPFVKGKLQAEITKTQLYEKVRRLKQKYFKNAERVGRGEDLVFSKPHEGERFDLSKRIWGGGLISNGDTEKVHVNGNSDSEKVKKHGKVESLDASAKKHEKISRKNSTKKQKIEEKNDKVEEKDLVKEEEVKDADDGGDFEGQYPFTYKAYNSLPGLITSEQVSLLKANLSVVGSKTSEEFEEKWKELQVEETELLLKKFLVFADHTRRALDAIKKK